MVRPELGTKRLCPNCGAKYYDLNHDPIMCPKCNASFATGIVAARAEPDDDDEVDADDEGVELVALEDADETAASSDDSEEVDPAAEEITVDADEDALIEDEDEEVSGVVRAADDEDEET